MASRLRNATVTVELIVPDMGLTPAEVPPADHEHAMSRTATAIVATAAPVAAMT